MASKASAKPPSGIVTSLRSPNWNGAMLGASHFFLERRPPEGLLSGQWQFPCGQVIEEIIETETLLSDDQTPVSGRRTASKRLKIAPVFSCVAGEESEDAVCDSAGALVDQASATIGLPRRSGAPGGSLAGSEIDAARDAALCSALLRHSPSLVATPATGGCPRDDVAALATQCRWHGILTHVFSHVRHTMHVASLAVPECGAAETGSILEAALLDRAPPVGRDGSVSVVPSEGARWMSRSEMRSVGITTGMMKVLRLLSVVLTDESPK